MIRLSLLCVSHGRVPIQSIRQSLQPRRSYSGDFFHLASNSSAVQGTLSSNPRRAFLSDGLDD